MNKMNLETIQRRLRRTTWQPKTAKPKTNIAYNHARFQFDDGSPASLAGHCYDLQTTNRQRPPYSDRAREIEEYLHIRKEDARSLNEASSAWHYGPIDLILPTDITYILKEYQRATTTTKSEYPLHVAGHLHRMDFTRRMDQILDLAKPSTATTKDCEEHKKEVTEKYGYPEEDAWYISRRKNGNCIYQFRNNFITACCYYKAFEAFEKFTQQRSKA